MVLSERSIGWDPRIIVGVVGPEMVVCIEHGI
jgi:hypothetical protein